MSSISLKKNPSKHQLPKSKRATAASAPLKRGSKLKKAKAELKADVFGQLGFSPIESRLLTIKADLLGEIRARIKTMGYSQAKVAELWGQSQPRVSEITQGRLESVTIDKLIDYLVRLGVDVSVTVMAS